MNGFVDHLNNINRAKWAMRWSLQGGSMHWKAHDLADLRNEDDFKRWRSVAFRILLARRQLGRMRRLQRKYEFLRSVDLA